MYSKASKQHLNEVDMTRWQHFKNAIIIAIRLELAACVVFIHAIFPRWFQTYATDTCKRIVLMKE